MNKIVKTKDVIKLLKSLGFDEVRRGTHAIFKEPKSGVLLTLPIFGKEVPPIYVSAMAQQVIGRGLMSEKDLEGALYLN